MQVAIQLLREKKGKIRAQYFKRFLVEPMGALTNTEAKAMKCVFSTKNMERESGMPVDTNAMSSIPAQSTVSNHT